KPVPPKASIEMVNPAGDRTVNKRKFTVEFRVRSRGPIKSVEVRHQDREVESLRQDREKQDLYRAEVELRPGLNRLKVIVTNEGGPTVAERTVSFVPETGRLHLERLERQDRRGELKIEEGWKIAERAEVGNLWLHGYIEWSEKEAVPQEDLLV